MNDLNMHFTDTDMTADSDPDADLATQSAPADADDFPTQLLTFYNHAAVTLMISLGHRLQLFDVLAEHSPATSGALAQHAGLAERYVREWLAALVTGGVVHYDAATRQYRLPQTHARFLTRAAAPNNLAAIAQHVPVMSSVQGLIEECFRSGDGLPYSAFPCFHEVMAEDSGQTVVAALFDFILPLVPGLTERLEQGIRVLDAGCGAGKALLMLAQAFPSSEFTGYDLCADAFTGSQNEAARLGLDNLHFAARDLRDFSEPGRYGLITSFDAVHDQADPMALLRGIARALQPDGVYLMQDVAGSSHLENNLAHPAGPLLYSISCMHCTPVSLGQGGPGLGTLWGEELALEMLEDAGFQDVQVKRLEHDPFNTYFIARTR